MTMFNRMTNKPLLASLVALRHLSLMVFTFLMLGFSFNTYAATTTTLTTSATTAVVGVNVTLTASVAGVSPTGNVVFKDGTTTIGTVATTGTTATRTAVLSTNFTTVGSHSITAAYAGDANDAASTSAAKTVTATIKTTSTTLTTTPSTAAVGQSVTLTSTVTGYTPTGTVTFKDGTTTLGTGTLTPTGTGTTATATFNATFSTVASHSITVVYAGDANDKTSTSTAKAVTVTKATTTTAVTTSVTSAVIGQSVALTATVTGYTPTGTVTFKDGTTTIGTATLTGTGTTGTATLNTTFSTAASHSITAVYAGNTTNNTSTSAIQAITVTAANQLPTVSLTAPANNSSAVAPASFTLTANAADSDGTITQVAFYNGATLINTDNAAPYSFNVTGLAVGTYTFTAVATDNGTATTTSSAITVNVLAAQSPTVSVNESGSSTTTPATIPVTPSTSTIPLSVSVATPNPGASITKVEYFEGANLIGTVTAAPWSYNWNNVAVGMYLVTAKVTDSTGSSAVSTVVNLSPRLIPTVTITAPISPLTLGANGNYVLKANTVGWSTIAKVEFFNGTTLLGTANSPTTATAFMNVAVPSGGIHAYEVFNTNSWEVNWSNIPAGTYNITAKVTDNNSGIGVSAPVLVTVSTTAVTTTNLTTSANPVTVDQSITLTASVAGTAVTGPTGTVTFKEGATTIGTATLTGTGTTATATLNSSFTTLGAHSITAEYSGDSSNASSVSAVTTLTVAANTAPTVTITAPVNNASYTAPVSLPLTATATDSDGTLLSVKFYDGTTLLGTGTQQGTSSTYIYNWNDVPMGSYTLTAVATDNNNASTVSGIVQVTVTAHVVQTYYIHTDQLDTPRLITNSTNTKVWEWNNTDPFGNNPVNDDPNNTGTHFTFNQRLPGQYYDSETNTHYNYFRDYDPQTGRYIESDPIGLEGGINTFAYVENDPLSLFDEYGLAPKGGAIIWDGLERLPPRGGGGASSTGNISAGSGGGAKCFPEQGVIYKVPGNKTPSGKPYIGRSDNMPNRIKGARDGRDRTGAEPVGSYPKGDVKAGRVAEQKAINENGGVRNLDNKRNEIAPRKWQDNGL